MVRLVKRAAKLPCQDEQGKETCIQRNRAYGGMCLTCQAKVLLRLPRIKKVLDAEEE